MSIFLTGRRSATTTLAQIHAYDLNLCTDLHCSRRTLTLAAPRSCAATSSTNALMGVGCHQPVRLPRANPHSARGTTACHFPRFRSLKAFGRRPRCTPRRRDRPASARTCQGLSARPSEVISFCLSPCRAHPFVPTRSLSRPSRAGPVKNGRRADRPAPRLISRPLLDWPEHDGRLGRVGIALAARLSSRDRVLAPMPSTRRISNSSTSLARPVVWGAFSRSSVDVHGLVR